MKSGKKADFQGQLLDSSVKFNMDKKAQQMKYANNASGGHGESDMVYNVKADRVDSLRQTSWVEMNDKQNKTHLTQMQTLNSLGVDESPSPVKNTQSGHLKPVIGDHRFMTVTDSYFHKGRFTTKADAKDTE